MKKNQRVLFVIAVLLMGLSIKLPIWRIDIWAPQYPEGLSMQILANQIQGNLSQINILNHYIGMKHIVPSQIPELSLVPWILAGLTFLGVLVVLSNRLWLGKIWFFILMVAAGGGLYDFYCWGYDYGHHLSPDAPIKIDGLSYQPPLFGYKKILNIEAYSLPDLGAYALGIAMVLVLFAAYGKELISFFKAKGLARFLPLLAIFFLACTSGPERIQIGADHCDYCHMQITDSRFGGEIITRKGRVYKFDSLQCLQEYFAKNKNEAEEVFVVDYFHPDHLIKAEEAHFLAHAKVDGPMGNSTVTAVDAAALEPLKGEASGKVMKWQELSRSSF